jgi:dipeptidyl aminopeptidase/acylaminoacyl peptidase
MVFSAHGLEKSVLDYSDVFALEYASNPTFNRTGETLYFVKRSMDKMRDSTRSEIWQYNIADDSSTPVLTDIKGLSSFTVSPNGEHIAYVALTEQGSQIFKYFIGANRSVQLTQLDNTPYSLAWSPSGDKLAFLMRVETQKSAIFTDMPSAPKGATWSEPAKVIDAVQYRADGGGYTTPSYSSVFLLRAEGGLAQQLGKPNVPHSSSLVFSNDGEFLYASANLADTPALVPFGEDILRYNLETGEYQAVTQRKGSETAPKLSEDGKWLAFLYVEDEKLSYQFAELVIQNVANNEERRLTLNLDRSIDAFFWGQNSQHLIFSYIDAGKTKLAKVMLNGDIIGLNAELGGQSLGRPYTSGEFAISAQGAIAYTSASSQRPAELELLKPDGKTLPVTHLNDDWLTQKALADVQAFSVESTIDGRQIDAWIATPPNYDPTKQYPLILEIHGGPHAAYGPQFSMEIQLMAAKGYVVVWSNPRGSSSYGKDFGNLIHHNYPSNDYQDLMDVVDVTLTQSFVDKNNVFITGGSGGGTLTAWSIGKTKRFNAAVVAKPVINWLSFALTADAYPYFTQYWMAKMPWENQQVLWDHSPLSLVGNVTTPTMLLTGEADYRTPISETEQFYQALKLQNVEAVMVRIPGAGHGIASRPSRLIQKVGNIIAWFERYKRNE